MDVEAISKAIWEMILKLPEEDQEVMTDIICSLEEHLMTAIIGSLDEHRSFHVAGEEMSKETERPYTEHKCHKCQDR